MMFNARMKVLTDAGNIYFAKYPSQANEGTLDALITEARELATKRNQIAQSIPIVVAEEVKPGYAMVSQLYAVFRRPQAIDYWYGSREIDAYAQQFLALADRVAKFNELLDRTA